MWKGLWEPFITSVPHKAETLTRKQPKGFPH